MSLQQCLAEQVDKLAKTSTLYITNAGKTDNAVTYGCYFDMRLDGDALGQLTTLATLRSVSRLSMMRTLMRDAFASARKASSDHNRPPVGDHG